jgi:hypothetical protein
MCFWYKKKRVENQVFLRKNKLDFSVTFQSPEVELACDMSFTTASNASHVYFFFKKIRGRQQVIDTLIKKNHIGSSA